MKTHKKKTLMKMYIDIDNRLEMHKNPSPKQSSLPNSSFVSLKLGLGCALNTI